MCLSSTVRGDLFFHQTYPSQMTHRGGHRHEGYTFAQLMHERFDSECKGKLEWDAVIGIIAIAEEDDREEEFMEFLHENPTASLRDMLDYVTADFTEPLEIVDDDELDEDDWED